ncbi:MAG: anti-sigma factor [Cyanobacteria bacterium P01_F01_bin.53]
MTRFPPSDSNPYSAEVPYPDGWEDLLVNYALGTLSPEEEAAFQQLLKNYPELTLTARDYKTSVDSLPLALAEQNPPATLESRILRAAQATPQAISQPISQNMSSSGSVSARNATQASPKQKGEIAQQPLAQNAPSASALPNAHQNSFSKAQAQKAQVQKTQVRWVTPYTRQKTQQKWQKWGGFAVAAGLVAALGINNLQVRQQLTQANDDKAQLQAELDARTGELARLETTEVRDQTILTALRQPNALVYDLQGTGTAAEAFGSLLAVPNHSEVALVSDNLPPLPDGQVYRLWAVATPVDDPMFCGEFVGEGDGTAVWTVPDELCSNSPVQMIITVDVVSDPPVPKGPAVLKSTLQ